MTNTTESKAKTFKDIKTLVGIIKKVCPNYTWCTVQPLDQEGQPNGDYINITCKKGSQLPGSMEVGKTIACEYQMDVYWSNFTNEYKTKRTLRGTPIIVNTDE